MRAILEWNAVVAMAAGWLLITSICLMIYAAAWGFRLLWLVVIDALTGMRQLAVRGEPGRILLGLRQTSKSMGNRRTSS